ncbi:MAG: conjugal transfer protein TraC [Candidatus Berkelbacteria bacterium]|nr:conjugal transfer protein TraC [Candidatus Berkelbacteria bacterium]
MNQKQEEIEAKKIFEKGMTGVLDLIAPAAFLIRPSYLQLSDYYVKTLFVYAYPRYLYTNWLASIINYDVIMDISMFIYPIETKEMMTKLTRKVGELESTQALEQEKGKVRSPELETAIGDIEGLRDVLAKGEAKLFQLGLYFTIYAKTIEEIQTISRQLESTLGGLFYTKPAVLQMEQGFNSCLPLGNDQLKILRNLDTGSLSTTFPFVSATLTREDGILYGINMPNNSLVIFDRFSLENANLTCFGMSGSGKSFAIKLEALRYLMLGVDVIVVDPEDEYGTLCEAVGGSIVHVSLNSDQSINPFDLPTIVEGEAGQDVLNENIGVLKGLISLMVGGLSPNEDGVLEKALFETYGLKDITNDPKTHKNPPPLLSDLYSVLSNMKGAETITNRLMKYVEGIHAGLFNKPTNVDLKKGFVVFSIRDLDEELRPIAMYLIMHYIWNKVRESLRKRIMIIDEAWWMMQYEDSARFLYSLARRARKYWLGLTIVTQDVEDFITSKYGRAVVANSSLQLLLKQSPAAVEELTDAYKLTKGEEDLLLMCDIGEGLFFAGLNHVVIKVIASPTEHLLITSKPEEVLELKKLTKR